MCRLKQNAFKDLNLLTSSQTIQVYNTIQYIHISKSPKQAPLLRQAERQELPQASVLAS